MIDKLLYTTSGTGETLQDIQIDCLLSLKVVCKKIDLW